MPKTCRIRLSQSGEIGSDKDLRIRIESRQTQLCLLYPASWAQEDTTGLQ